MKFFEQYYTVESVTSGHPDKVCDQISDAILDAYLMQDKDSRVAIEAFGAHGTLVIGGEVTSTARVDVAEIARRVYKEIGYHDQLEIITRIVAQSPDIAQGVDTGGAGDQGIMYGYATAQTEAYLPRGVVFAHQLAQQLERLRTTHALPWLKPDGKTQVTMDSGEAVSVLVSTQHKESVSQEDIADALKEKLIMPVMGDDFCGKILINPTGKFVQGGFRADTGLTGRKIMVDTYGGLIPHGGGCFSGKDASKVDRSGAYMARFAAKNIVTNGYAKECLVSVAYAIGAQEPVMIHAIDEHGTSLQELVKKNFDFRPRAIHERLHLERPIYAQTATYGHFGRETLPWESVTTMVS